MNETKARKSWQGWQDELCATGTPRVSQVESAGISRKPSLLPFPGHSLPTYRPYIFLQRKIIPIIYFIFSLSLQAALLLAMFSLFIPQPI